MYLIYLFIYLFIYLIIYLFIYLNNSKQADLVFKNIIRKSTCVRYIIIALRKELSIPSETSFEYPCPF